MLQYEYVGYVLEHVRTHWLSRSRQTLTRLLPLLIGRHGVGHVVMPLCVVNGFVGRIADKEIVRTQSWKDLDHKDLNADDQGLAFMQWRLLTDSAGNGQHSPALETNNRHERLLARFLGIDSLKI